MTDEDENVTSLHPVPDVAEMPPPMSGQQGQPQQGSPDGQIYVDPKHVIEAQNATINDLQHKNTMLGAYCNQQQEQIKQLVMQLNQRDTELGAALGANGSAPARPARRAAKKKSTQATTKLGT